MNARLRPVATGLAGAAAMIAAVTVASRVVGFGRWLVQASEVGATALGTAYASANTLPNVLFEVAAGGALAGAVIPLLAVPLARSLRGDVDRISSALLGWALAVLVPLAVVVAVLARPLVALFRLDTPAQVDVAAGFLTAFAAQIPLYGIGVVLTGVLQAHRRFLWPALAPLLSSVTVIGVYLAFGAMVSASRDDPGAVPAGALAWLGWGTTAGVAVMSLPLLWPVARAGVRLRPALRFPPGVAGRARALALAGVGGLVAQQVSILVTLLLANDHGEAGTFPVLQFTQAVYLLPYAVLAVPLATASFPRLAERAANGDGDGFARLTATTTRAVLLVSAVGVTALVATAPAVEAAFARFTDGDVTGMADALAWMAPGLLGFALVFHVSRALYALHRGRSAVLATAAGWLTVVVVSLVSVPLMTGTGPDQEGTLRALAVSSTVGMTVAAVGLVVALVRAAGRPAATGVARTTAVITLGGAVGAWAGRTVTDALLGQPSLAAAIAVGAAGAVVGGLTVLGGAWLLDRTVVRTLAADRSTPAPDVMAGAGDG